MTVTTTATLDHAAPSATAHTTLRHGDGRDQWLTLVGYAVDGEQLGVAVLTGG